jgi:FkbM family methyltransferase
MLLSFLEVGSPHLWRLAYRVAPWLPIRWVTATVFTGHKLILPFRDKRTHEISRFGVEGPDCEIRLARHYVRTLNETSVFFDIGANFGYFTAIGEVSGARVSAFEANEKLYEILKMNFPARGTDIVNALITDDEGGAADFYLVQGNEGRSTAKTEIAKQLTAQGMSISKSAMRTMTIDGYVEQTRRVPTHVKIDVEGSEHDVLRGMEDTLRRHCPEIVTEVWGGEQFEYSRNAIIFLESFGYTPFVIEQMGLKATTLEELSRMRESHDNIAFLKTRNA